MADSALARARALRRGCLIFRQSPANYRAADAAFPWAAGSFPEKDRARTGSEPKLSGKARPPTGSARKPTGSTPAPAGSDRKKTGGTRPRRETARPPRGKRTPVYRNGTRPPGSARQRGAKAWMNPEQRAILGSALLSARTRKWKWVARWAFQIQSGVKPPHSQRSAPRGGAGFARLACALRYGGRGLLYGDFCRTRVRRGRGEAGTHKLRKGRGGTAQGEALFPFFPEFLSSGFILCPGCDEDGLAPCEHGQAVPG